MSCSYCTRIYVEVDDKKLMKKLGELDISDLGKGFYTAKELFHGKTTSYYRDSESAINEFDLQELVKRVVEVIKGHGKILGDTWSYDYDPMPQTCYYIGDEIKAKLLDMDGGEFEETVEIENVSEWIKAVEETDEFKWEEPEEDEDE